MSNIVFKPIIPFVLMVIYSVILIVIIVVNRKNVIVRILIVLLILLISQRPVIEDYNNKFYRDLDILFVVDTSLSMNAVDVNGNTRLSAAKNDCKSIMQKFLGARYAVISFNNYSMVKLPFTDDITIAYDIIDSLEVIDPNYAKGSSLDLPYENINELLNSSKNKEGRMRIMFFISDGEVNLVDKTNKNLDKYDDIKKLIDNGAVLGYGTLNGAKIRIDKALSKEGIVDESNYLIDKTSNKNAISKLNENSLLYLKDKLSLDYYNMKKNGVLDKKIKEIKKMTKETIEDPLYYDKDLYYYFSPIIIILFIYDLCYVRRNEQ